MPAFVRSGAEIAVNSQTTSSQTKSSIVGLADGGFVVVWQTSHTAQDGSGSAIKLQRYNAQGIAVGGETLVNSVAAGDQIKPQATALASGGYVVTWETTDATQDGNGTAIKARMYDAAGNALGGEFRVNSQAFANQQQPTITGLADGGFVVAWQTTDSAQDGAGWAVKAQRYDAAGAAVGGEFLVNSVAFGSQNTVDIAGLSNGGFVVTWQTGNDANTRIYAQAYNADGSAAGGQFQASAGWSSHLTGKVAPLADGGFVVTWLTGGDLTVRAQIFDGARNKVGAEFSVNTGTANRPMNPDVAALADGTFMVTWADKDGIVGAQSYSATGQALGGPAPIQNTLGEVGSDVSVTALAGGTFAISWTEVVTGGSTAEDIRVQLTAPNTAPQLGAETRAVSVSENNQAVWTFTASDADGPAPVSYTIAGGADAARFTINAAGQLRFAVAPNFEAPTDAGGNNVYEVVVRASDSDLSDTQAVSVTVTNVNEAPVITSNGAGASAAISVAENGTAVTTVTANDPEGSAITYSISGGADAARFAIDPASGALRFVAAPDFEAPADADANNVYLVTVRASDGSLIDTQTLSVTVTDVAATPVIVSDGGGSSAAIAVNEGEAAVTTVAATSLDGGGPLGYAIAGGADAALFAIDAGTGALSFVAAPDFEAPADAGGDNTYEVVVSASSGGQSDTQALTVTVLDANEAPVITSNGGGIAGVVTLTEGATLATTVTATGGAISYAIAGGADAALFAIDAGTGALSFVAAPDFEAPADAGGDNAYEVVVSASSGGQSDTQALTVTVLDTNEAPAISSAAAVSLGENGTAVTTVAAADPEGGVSYAIAGGADAALFAIDAETGELGFFAAPDFEAPGDADGDNVYAVVVSASDGALSDTQALTVTVGNVNEGVSVTSGAAFAVAENGLAVTTVIATDLDGTAPGFAITGGADAAAFAIDAVTGALSFGSAPDFEAPADADGDNVYEVVVTASDGALADSQALAVTVGNLNDNAPVLTPFASDTIVSAMAEGNTGYFDFGATDADGGTVVFSLAGEDAASLTIDSATGFVQFLAAPDFEAPGSALGSNSYVFDVIASDGALSDVLHVTLHVFNLNEPLAIVSDGGGEAAALTAGENGTAVTTVVAEDADLTAPTYAISGGADAARFAIDAGTGTLSFVAAPDFEAPADADGDNVYEVVVTASDGTFTDSQALVVTVANANEAPAFVSGTTASATENQAAVAVVAAADPEGVSLSYAIAGGADAALFAIDAQTGALSFIAAPDFEAPADADADGTYDVVVSASDGSNTVTQAIAVAVTGVNEGLAIVSDGGGAAASLALAEGASAVTTVAALDADGDAVSYTIAGGADAALFAIDAETGALAFVGAPDFEAPGDADGDNAYEVVVAASDGEFTAVQALTVAVGNVNESLAFTSGSSAAVAEGEVAVTTVAATDADGDAITYAITGGADAALFAIDPETGVLVLNEAPDFEAPADAEGDNLYALEVSASDGSFTVAQALSVSVGNVNEAPVISSFGGGDSAALGVSENATAVSVLAASDPDSTVAYTILGGPDAARFVIDPVSGALGFVAAPDFEAPADADGDNVYHVVIGASDGSLSDVQVLAITVGDVNEAPVIVSGGGGATASLAVGENGVGVTTVVAGDAEGGVSYALAGGADAARFAIDTATGVLSFLAAPDFEAPADADGDNVYEVIVSAGDGSLSDTQALSVSVGNVNEAPVIGSNGGGASAAVAASENATVVTTVAAGDAEGGVTYTLAGGADAARFTIDATTGVLSFVTAPNFEAPADVGGNNVYEVIVGASDGSLSDTQALSVTVGNVNEAPVISSGGGGATAGYALNENATAVATIAAGDPEGGVTYALAGGADAARFTINAATGALSFVTAPDFDAPTDADVNNVYEVVVRASDGSLEDTQALTVTVGNLVDGLTLNGNGSSNGLTGSYEEDTLNGNGGADTLRGLGAADLLDGGSGNDVLNGGAGADRLTGGAGADRFEFSTVGDSTAAASDLIVDFVRSQSDKLELDEIDANVLAGGNQAFSFIGGTAFSNVAGQLRYFQQSGDTIVQGDVNGDGVADFQFAIDSLVTLQASDFIL